MDIEFVANPGQTLKPGRGSSNELIQPRADYFSPGVGATLVQRPHQQILSRRHHRRNGRWPQKFSLTFSRKFNVGFSTTSNFFNFISELSAQEI